MIGRRQSTILPVCLERWRARAPATLPVNDNDPAPSDVMLQAALRHFARYGLASAQHAETQASASLRSGDSDGYHQWLGICRVLDRRRAARLDGHRAAGRRHQPALPLR